MKLGLVIYGSLDARSGGYLYDRMLVNHLLKQGDQVEVISLAKKDYFWNISNNFSSQLSRLLDSDIDILLQDELNHSSLFLFNRRLRRRAKYQLISIVHHLSYSAEQCLHRRLIFLALERKYLSTINGYVFNSQTTMRAVESVVRRKVQCIVACPGRDHIQPSMNVEKIDSRINRANPMRILFLGNLVPHKGLHTLIKALSQVAGNWILTVIGNPSISPHYVESIHDLVDRKKINSQVDFLGYVPQSELHAAFEDSHLLALPSFHEGFGLSYLEALGFGLPVVATTGGAAKEIITNGQEGFLVPPGDDLRIAEVLSCLMQDSSLLRKMSINALYRYQRFPTWSESMRTARDFLVDSAGKRRHS